MYEVPNTGLLTKSPKSIIPEKGSVSGNRNFGDSLEHRRKSVIKNRIKRF